MPRLKVTLITMSPDSQTQVWVWHHHPKFAFWTQTLGYCSPIQPEVVAVLKRPYFTLRSKKGTLGFFFWKVNLLCDPQNPIHTWPIPKQCHFIYQRLIWKVFLPPKEASQVIIKMLAHWCLLQCRAGAELRTSLGNVLYVHCGIIVFRKLDTSGTHHIK